MCARLWTVLKQADQREKLVGRGLSRYNIQTAALSETHLAEEGQIKEVGVGYTFFWSGRRKEERRMAGVGFAIKSDLVSKLSCLLNRIMSLKLPLSRKGQATLISAY